MDHREGNVVAVPAPAATTGSTINRLLWTSATTALAVAAFVLVTAVVIRPATAALADALAAHWGL